MELSHTGEGITGYYQNSHTPDIENTSQSHYQKLNVKVISVDDNQYDQLSPGTFEETKPYDGYLQLPEFNRENTESNYDSLKLYGSVKTNQCPDIGSIELSDFPIGKNVDIGNGPSDKIKQDSVALDSIHLNEDMYFEINDTAQPNLNQAHQGSKKHLDVSQTLRTNNDATNTGSHKKVSKRTCLTWKHKCMLFVMVVVITVVIAVGTVIYILVNKKSEKEVQTHVSCTHVSNARLYVGPIEMLCTIPTSEKFEFVGFYYGTGLDNSLYGIVLNRNGTIFQIHKTNSDIYVSLIEITSQYMLIITFSNVSCAMDGVYRLALMRLLVGVPEEYKGTNGYLQVKSATGKPVITLNADQVIDLVFPDGNYYRGSSSHKCEGLIGNLPSKLEIDITYDNGSSFQQISNENIGFSRTYTSDECSTKETVSFGLKFSSDMDGARLRCRISDSMNDFTLSEELSLIPRNICNCSESYSYRGHPSNCKVQVFCVTEDGIAYPRGIACTTNQCRNSITGVCDTDCSDTVCNETVPSDFCTTPAPPTTTPAPSPYIVCTDTVALINSGPSVITCYLNNRATFGFMNVTYVKLRESDVQQIALIDDSNTINMFAMEDIVSISILNNIIKITISNPTCNNEGTFAVVTDINGETVMDQGTFRVISKPSGDATLQLHPDQIAGLKNYRSWLLHSCKINVGYPPGEISIEMLKQDDAEFTKLNVVFHTTNNEIDNTTCSITRTVKFGFVFTADMDKATVRCSVTNDFSTEDPFVYSNNDTVYLIPIGFCKNETDVHSYHPHPTNCHSFVQCEGDVTYGVLCPSGQCFGVTETYACNYCSQATCPADVTTIPLPGSSISTSAIAETTTPEPTSAIDVSCTDTTVLLNTGPGVIICTVNANSFSMMNVTFKKKIGQIPTLVALINSDGSIADTSNIDLTDVKFTPFTVTISISNVSCTHEGYYGVIVDSGNDLTGTSEGRLTTTEKPSGTIDIMLHPEQIIGLTTLRTYNVHTCSGQIGNPAGKIEVEILLDGANNFQTVDLSYSSSTNDTDNCMVTQVFKYLIAFTSGMYNATIRCKITNNEFPSVPPIYSSNETLALVPHDFCNINYNGTNKYPNPSDPCNKYVNCVEDTPYGKACAMGECFNPESSGFCDHCYNMDSCP